VPGERGTLTGVEAAVFRALQEDGRMPFTTVADRLGVSEAHVRRTVKQLGAKDVMTITAVADPRLLGLESMAWLALSVRLSHIDATAAALAGLPEVDYVVITSGWSNVMAEVACPTTDDLFELVRRVRALPGVQGAETFPYFKLMRQQFRWIDGDIPAAPGPQVPARAVRAAPGGLDDLDRRLVFELQRDGRASFRDVGLRLGVSERAVSARYARLVDADLVRVIAVGNPQALGFDGLAFVGMTLADDADVDDVAAALGAIPQLSYLVCVSGRFDVMGELVCRDPDHLIETLDRGVGAIDGIAAVDVFFYLRLLYRTTAGAWGAARSGGGVPRPAGVPAR
jgi:Lrp/AsnC family transcriptional regulator, regulator for asnA, asnC and gidA